MSGLPRPALTVGNGRLNDSASNNSTLMSNASSTDQSEITTPKSRQRIQNDTSLGATAKRFVGLMTGACDQVLKLPIILKLKKFVFLREFLLTYL